MRACTCSILLAAGQLLFAASSSAQSSPEAMHALAEALIEAEIPARDDPDLVVAQLLEAATGLASSSAAQLAIESASGYSLFLTDPERALTSLEAFLQASPHPLAAQGAEAMRHQLLRRLGRLNPEEAETLFADYASDLIAIGPFGDEGDFYSAVPFSPELSFPESGETLEGRYGPIDSYRVTRNSRSSFIALNRPGRDEQGCYYGLHQIHSDTEQAVYIELDCSGSFEAFLNGRLLARLDRLSGPGKRISYLPARLVAGA
ncbi:MAG: fibroblast growth factor, partial [Planctomycetota bacterium]